MYLGKCTVISYIFNSGFPQPKPNGALRFFPSSLTFSLNLQIMPSFCTLSLFSVVSSSQVWDGKVVKKIPVTYNCLSFINIERINHVTDELVYVLHLLLQSSNLENLQISISYLSKLFVYTLTCSWFIVMDLYFVS